VLDRWEEFQELIHTHRFRSWAFRGHREADWRLISSLSRYFLDHEIHPRVWPQQEARILRIFLRKAHLLLDKIPEENNSFEWLALMQHHGAPTRILDFTWSPYVAAFFALEQAMGDSAVWALNPAKLDTRFMRTISADPKIATYEQEALAAGEYEETFLPNQKRIVFLGEPHRMNQRLIAQSGTFVIPGVLDVPIEELLPADAIVKLIFKEGIRRDAMADLYSMNISNATLFSGLDGLARSLAYELEHHWAYDPVTLERYQSEDRPHTD